MTQQEVIKTFMTSLNNTTLKGGKALDEAIKNSSSFKNFAAVKSKFLADIKAAKNWHTFLVEKCGIILDNADTGAISGSDAGGSKAKSATDILPSTGDAKYPTGKSFTVDGLTIYGIPKEKNLTADQKYVIRGLYSWWIRDALALIKESYGFSFTDVDTTNARLKMKFVDEPDSGTFAYVAYDTIDDNKTYESRVLCVNMAQFQNMSADNRHGSTGTAALDRVLVHELVHGIMASNVNYAGSLPQFLVEGGSAELIHGLDDENYDEIVSYAKDPSIFENILTTNEFEDPPYEIYTGGYMFMRYFAKQAATDTKFDYDTRRATISVGGNGGFATNYHDTVTMNGGAGSDTLTNSGSKVLISAGAGNDSIKTYSDSVTVNGDDGGDFILNEGSKVTLYGGKGSDLLQNVGDKTFLDGGEDNDFLINNGGDSVKAEGGAGNDFISNNVVDYEKGKTLKAGGETTNGATLNAEDGKIYKVDVLGGGASSLSGGAGTDTIYNYASQAFVYGDADDDSLVNYGFNVVVNGGEGNDFILNTANEVELYDDTVSVTGYKSSLIGGDGNDTISNTSGAVSIYGGTGVDSVRNDGQKARISLGAGDDFAINYADSVIAKGEANNDELINFGDSVTLNGGAGNDDLSNYGDYGSALGEKGNDTIYNSGEAITVNGGEGNDYLINDGVNSSIVDGKNNDTIENYGEHVTLSGGVGNDSIKNDGGRYVTYEIGKSDGKDIVEGFGETDTVKITTKGNYNVKSSGNDVIIKVGSATLTLKGVAGQDISVIEKNGKEYTWETAAGNVAWFMEDDNNFSDNQLSELVETKTYLPPAQVDSVAFVKENNFITYSNKK